MLRGIYNTESTEKNLNTEGTEDTEDTERINIKGMNKPLILNFSVSFCITECSSKVL